MMPNPKNATMRPEVDLKNEIRKGYNVTIRFMPLFLCWCVFSDHENSIVHRHFPLFKLKEAMRCYRAHKI